MSEGRATWWCQGEQTLLAWAWGSRYPSSNVGVAAHLVWSSEGPAKEVAMPRQETIRWPPPVEVGAEAEKIFE